LKASEDGEFDFLNKREDATEDELKQWWVLIRSIFRPKAFSIGSLMSERVFFTTSRERSPSFFIFFLLPYNSIPQTFSRILSLTDFFP